jgi:hypothetical protein
VPATGPLETGDVGREHAAAAQARNVGALLFPFYIEPDARFDLYASNVRAYLDQIIELLGHPCPGQRLRHAPNAPETKWRWDDFCKRDLPRNLRLIAATTIAVLGVVTPSFVVALVLILVLSLGLQLLPTGGWGDSWQQAIMPVLAFSFGLIAIVARFTRSSVIEVLRSDFIRAARAKGLSQGAVLRRHVLRNALTPVVTIAGPMFAGVITGSFFIETIFRIPGIGQYFTTSAFQRDYPMIMALTLLYAALITLVYFITDLVYAWIDPRVRVGGVARSQ